jgi:hypothetical protein
MNYKEQSDKKNIVTNIKSDKVDKKKESKTTPRVNPKISAYDRVVQLVTSDNTCKIVKCHCQKRWTIGNVHAKT